MSFFEPKLSTTLAEENLVNNVRHTFVEDNFVCCAYCLYIYITVVKHFYGFEYNVVFQNAFAKLTRPRKINTFQ